MKAWQTLWHDDRGAVLSAEMVLVGTLGVVGATVGLKAVADSVNGELLDVARALRSLDQSYSYRGIAGCGASTAGSAFQQEPVETSLQKLDARIEELRASEEAANKAAGDEAAQRGAETEPKLSPPAAETAPAARPRGDRPAEEAPAKPAPKKKPKAKTEVIL